MIPLLHDFRDQTVLVFGGGPVGARKAKRFAREARVVVVSPTFDGRFEGDPLAAVERVRATPAAEDVESWIDRLTPALVVAATDDDAVNDAAVAAATRAGALVNRADRSGERGAGEVVVPATVRDGPVTIAVATDGTSPALSKYLRERLETEFAGAGAMAELSGELRRELKAAGVPPAERREAIRAVVRSSAVWKALHTGASKARQEAARVIRDTRGDAR
ncbi:precorrin-2 dehydrogenase/sirohydrochlorin ferrochelatase family protein [Haloferacaceae archaeon DSL9]